MNFILIYNTFINLDDVSSLSVFNETANGESATRISFLMKHGESRHIYVEEDQCTVINKLYQAIKGCGNADCRSAYAIPRGGKINE